MITLSGVGAKALAPATEIEALVASVEQTRDPLAACLRVQGYISSYGRDLAMQLVMAQAIRRGVRALDVQTASCLASLIWRGGEIPGRVLQAAILAAMTTADLHSILQAAGERLQQVATLVAEVGFELCRADMLAVAMTHEPEAVYQHMAEWLAQEHEEAIYITLMPARISAELVASWLSGRDPQAMKALYGALGQHALRLAPDAT